MAQVPQAETQTFVADSNEPVERYDNDIPDIDELKNDGKGGKPFRIQNKYLWLTYSNVHINKEWYKNVFLKRQVKWKFEKVEMAHEYGSSKFEGYKHTHVYLESMSGTFQSTNARVLDLDPTIDRERLLYEDETGAQVLANGHPFISVPKNKTHVKNVLRYMGKEDPENAHLLIEELSLVEKLWQAPNARAAICGVKRISDVPATLAAYAMKQAEARVKTELLFGWQLALKEWLVNASEDWRTINWLFCAKGDTGKSMFCKHMMDYFPDDFRVLTSLGREADALNNLGSFLKEGWTGKYLWIDLPRTYEDRETVYTVMEQLKNGSFTATKYAGGTFITPYRPHIFVSANFLPELNKMSLDRWNILEMTGEKPDCWLRKLTLNEAFERKLVTDMTRQEKKKKELLEQQYNEKMAEMAYWASRGIPVDRNGRPIFPASNVPLNYYGSSSSALPTSSTPPPEYGVRTDFSRSN